MTLPTTPPVPDPVVQAPTLIDVGTQALLNNARRLGLAWNMTTATVTRGTDPTTVLAICDGDSVPILMQSMIGPIVANTRVYAIQVFSTGSNYIAGVVGTPNSNRPIAALRPTAAQSIPNATITPITFGEAMVDTNAGWSANVNQTRYTAPLSGYYKVEGSIFWQASGAAATMYRVNGSTLVTSSSYDQTNTIIQGRAAIVRLQVNEFVELIAFQSTGAPRNTGVDNANLQLNTSFVVEYMRPL